MKFDTSAIEGFENMTVEQKLAAVLEAEIEAPDATRLKSALSKASSEAAEYKRQLRAKQSEQEAAEAEKAAEQERLLSELKELRAEKIVAQHKAKFLSVGYAEDLAESSAKAMVDGDTDRVFTNLSKFLADREKTAKAEAMRNMSHPVSGNAEITKEQFGKMSYSERVELFKTSPELYKKLTD